MNEKLLLTFATKQDCRSAYRLIRKGSGLAYNYTISCEKDDPALSIISIQFNRYISSNNQDAIAAWENIVKDRISYARRNK
jgi:hypothetical protein